MSKGNPFLSLRVSFETIERLRELSDHRGCGVSDVAREALAVGLMTDPVAATAAATLSQDTHRIAKRRLRLLKPTRIQRVSTATEALRQLLAEYEDWQANQPEFAATSATAEKLEVAIEALEAAIDALELLDPPRGFGRD